ncbi:hypothetical protein, partial [Xanthomonas translucens]|uniref:hypothetical protein n=1 Tax=Xanthomonas campestris pv. translucens TaxID=343 RepID=UPI003CE49BAD
LQPRRVTGKASGLKPLLQKSRNAPNLRKSRVPSPESRVPSPESRVPSPESRVPSPESRTKRPN